MKKVKKQLLYLLLSLFCLLMTSCVDKSGNTFTVFQLNLWGAGSNVPDGHQGIVDVLSQIDADVVFLCEIHGNKTVSRIVDDLKKRNVHYYGEAFDLNVGILSKIKPDSVVACCTVPGNEIRTMLKAVITIEGQPVSFYSAHLDHQNYACYLPRGYSGATWQKIDGPVTEENAVLEANRLSFRDESIRSFLQHVQEDLRQGNPVILGGDFNEPSHLDWQADTKDLRDHNGAIINWDCSVLLYEACFTDTFREKYPDPVRYPGIIYPAGNEQAKLEQLTWAPDADEQERIDFIYYFSGDSVVSLTNSKLVGPSETVIYNKIERNTSKDRVLTPKCVWPSDHKGNLATFKIKQHKN